MTAISQIRYCTVSIFGLFKIHDIVLRILDFLAFKDVFSLLLKTIPQQITTLLPNIVTKNILKLQLIKHFGKFVEKFGLKSKTLMKVIKKVNGVIAGGFALAIFTGELYDQSDMDIYIAANSVRSFEFKLRQLKHLLQRNSYIENITTSTISKYPQYTYYEYINIAINRKIQILYHYTTKKCKKRVSTGNLVINGYDLTPVMCFIENGNKNKTRFHCEHVYDIMNKTLQLNQNCPRLRNITKFKTKLLIRLYKYKTRGYKLSHTLNDLIPNIIEEVEIYETSRK
jgi:hypothetical protein